ncbi:MAG: class I SAM-dependent methyltransferase [Candidatus Peregrinibacteria bacterium]
MQHQLLYRSLAKYYDRIYSWKNYRKEVKKLESLIHQYQQSSGKRLLEVGCGTGGHLNFLQKNFDCMGVDLNPEMLMEARKKLKAVPLKKADMTTLNLRKKFDVILCLFSSIGYARTKSDLKRTIENFSKHLVTGGVVIIEPWFQREEVKKWHPDLTIYDGSDTKIARIGATTVKGDCTVTEMSYLIGDADGKIWHTQDQHVMRLFEKKKVLNMMEKAGLDSCFLATGLMKRRGLLVGVKQ